VYNSVKNIGEKMKRNELIKMLDFLDSKEVWCFDVNMFSFFFPSESKQVRNVSLKRHAQNGIIVNVCRGFYANPRAKSMPAFPICSLARIIRSSDRFYVSYETALNNYNIISQIPFRLTLSTSGRSQTYNTPYGVIEFTYSSRVLQIFENKECARDDFLYDGLYCAAPKVALRDAIRANRNVGLIDFTEVDEAIRHFNEAVKHREKEKEAV
jgi:hypothetical protein